MKRFSEVVDSYLSYGTAERFSRVTKAQVLQVLGKRKLEEADLIALLSPAGAEVLELMAQKAQELTLRQFGRSIKLYTPLYLGNFCVNQCVYCGYNTENSIRRSRLTEEQLHAEAKAIRSTGLRHILLLTGEDPVRTSVEYIGECIQQIKDDFDSIALEIYPLKVEGYEKLVQAGADSLTVYQETYDREVYKQVHPAGPKSNYEFRLDAADRAAEGGMRGVGIGALLGLSDWRRDAFLTAMHGAWLSKNHGDVELSLSVPRLRPCTGGLSETEGLTDKELVQVILAYRIFLPHAGINVSTRESREMRDHLIPLGVTAFSAGVCTSVGGHTDQGETTEPQFQISDSRSVEDMKKAIISYGWQPVFKDWIGKGF